MNITVIGTAYVGLVSGACFSEFGHNVTCMDKDNAKIEGILADKIPMYETDFDALVKKNIEDGRLNFSTDLAAAVTDAKPVLIAVGTPPPSVAMAMKI